MRPAAFYQGPDEEAQKLSALLKIAACVVGLLLLISVAAKHETQKSSPAGVHTLGSHGG